MASNPLRRTSDLVEAWCRLALVVLALASLPAAVVVSLHVLAHLEAAAARDATARHAVPATVLDQPRAVALPGRALPTSVARVTWTEPGREPMAGTAVVPASAVPGSRTTVWVTRGGGIAAPPLARSDALALSALSGTALFLGMLGLVAVLASPLRRWLDRGRYRSWALAWERLDAARSRGRVPATPPRPTPRRSRPPSPPGPESSRRGRCRWRSPASPPAYDGSPSRSSRRRCAGSAPRRCPCRGGPSASAAAWRGC